MPSADSLLDALDPEQREVALALRGPVCVIAGAGTGKTRAITHRIAYGAATGVYKTTEVLAVTFTARAAGEMRGRLRQLGAEGVQARTFHAAALRQIGYFWPRLYGNGLPQLIASKIPLVAEAARRCRVQTDSALLRDLAAEIEWAKVSNVRPDDYPRLAPLAHRGLDAVDDATVAHVMAAYEEVKRDRGRMDMEDVLLCTVSMLAEHERVAAEIRRQYRWLVVDEYQDVNPLQAALLEQWLGGRHDICVVGDPLQTIYSFAGASPKHLNEFSKHHPGTQRIELVRNYRSTPQVVAAANAVFSRGRRDGVVLRAQREPGPAVTYTSYSDEVAEAESVAAQILQLREGGTSLRDMAILFRTNAQSEAYEEALAARNLAYVVRGVERFFDRAEVRQAVTLLRGQARGGDAGEEGLVSDVRTVLATMGYTESAPTTAGAQRDRWESLHAVVSMAADLQAARPDADLTALVDDLDRRAKHAHAPIAEGVTLTTLHAAKGLEWDAVFLVGMQEGTVPIAYATDDAGVEEERRLFYVGVTRARDRLEISWSLARNPGGRGNRRPSRFLDGLRPADAEPVVGAGRSRRTRKERSIARCRSCDAVLTTGAERKLGRCLDCPSSYDEDLFERLRGWRSEQASAQKVPAYVVFTDATLTAIAEARPREETDLLKVPGVGRAKLEKYGADVLALCEA
ncbi:ATP-dependent DNA helicase UvrD2 [Mumia sp. zg.B53]|uniref:ATP-dependent DNA helicase UvrD2 n=1 Tax=unclassified Mumia TaxID=2621872 RepID=UPI001C6E283E|nr:MULTISPECIES: ATP-dependent DNA helicase UvrD2 [unclassified Mumia]MBW9215556.1 ATP-dependent DNA helicase UvrD2 [Mumia sp. zg.B53]MDD9348604.1 ATP-dependent DNA helicase UvrD2 [Mumia sp.]